MEQINKQKFLHEVEKMLKRFMGTPSLCMYPGCNSYAINSHVFQEKRILIPIAPTKHLYCFEPNSLFNQNQRFSFNRIGIKHVLSFLGFCNHHDNQIFSSIEKMDDVDWLNPKSQFLLGYKALCRDLYVKELAVKYYNSLLEKYPFPKVVKDSIILFKKGFELGINDLNRYKVFLESTIFNSNFSQYSFETYKLPFYLELCVASPISISYSIDIPNKDILDSDLPENNIVLIFPYMQKTYVIIGFAKDFENRWAKEFVEILKTQDSLLISKSLSDLILFRSDFNCMSENLYSLISDSELKEFYKEYELYLHSKSFYLSTQINIFKHFNNT